MCTKIETEFFLASMLHYRNEITFQDVKKYTDQVYSHLKGQHLFLDTCLNSIYGAIHGSPDVFCLKEEGVIARGDNTEKYFNKFFILEHLGRSLDNEIKNSVFDLVKA